MGPRNLSPSLSALFDKSSPSPCAVRSTAPRCRAAFQQSSTARPDRPAEPMSVLSLKSHQASPDMVGFACHKNSILTGSTDFSIQRACHNKTRSGGQPTTDLGNDCTAPSCAVPVMAKGNTSPPVLGSCILYPNSGSILTFGGTVSLLTSFLAIAELFSIDWLSQLWASQKTKILARDGNKRRFGRNQRTFGF